MRDKEVVKKGNKAIALFTEWIDKSDLSSKSFLAEGYCHIWREGDHREMTTDKLRYHESFDELLPTIQKIKSMGMGFKITNEQGWNWCVIWDQISDNRICDSDDENWRENNEIDVAWITIVKFIEWYNTKKENKV